jgi:integrase
VQNFLAGLKYKVVSAQTSNFYLAAMKQFCRWMVCDNRATESPIQHMKGRNVRVDRRHDRRALSVAELRHLLTITRNNRAWFGVDGPQRALLYQLSAETGLRRGELRSLTASSFNFETTPATVTVAAGYAKNRELAMLPLRSGMSAAMKAHLADKLPNAPAFKMPSLSNVARMLKKDLEAAGIAYRDSSGAMPTSMRCATRLSQTSRAAAYIRRQRRRSRAIATSISRSPGTPTPICRA